MPGEDDLLEPQEWPAEGVADTGTPEEPLVVEDQPRAEEAEEPEVKEELPKFDEKHKLAFEGLTYLGKLESTFKMWGHELEIRTLTQDELLEVGLVVRDYEGVVGMEKAYVTAVAAASIQAVDGKFLPFPMTKSKDNTVVLNKFNYVVANWYPPIIDRIYEEYLKLERQVQEVLDELGNTEG